MNKRIADYKHKVVDNIIFIEDQNLGNISLTNSMEYVLEDIEKKYQLNLKSMTIIQIDSMGEYSEVLWNGNIAQWKILPRTVQNEYVKLMK